MRLLATGAALAVATIAAPALADETRVEVRGGIVWCCGISDETIGLALGHDFDIGTSTFIGVEAVADTNFDFVDPTIGVNARIGGKLGESGKLFGVAGYAYETTFDLDDFVLGAGYQHNLGSNALISFQYLRYMDTDINRAAVGVGYRF